MDLEATAGHSSASNDHDECDDPGCACCQGTGELRPGDGAAEVTMTEVYDIEFPWDHRPSDW